MELSLLKYDPIPFLMGPHQPAWVKYQTLVKILQRPKDDSEVIYLREKRDNSANVVRMRIKQNQDGSFPCLPWMHIHKYYFHQMLEMGYNLEDFTVSKAAENLLNYQLPNGGYMHPCGRYVNEPDPKVGWAACVTGYVTFALIELGFQNDYRVKSVIEFMYNEQRQNGGWICNTNGVYSPYCIKSGTPWIFLCLAVSGRINKNSQVAQKTLAIFKKHKNKIIRHGYKRDRFYRCDESLVLPALKLMGMTKKSDLIKDFTRSLIKKQEADGSWHFCEKPSAWYTLEVLKALNYIYA